MGEKRNIEHIAGPDAVYPLVYDARGNGEGGVAPTITGDHENRITDYTAIVLCDTRSGRAGRDDAE